MAWTYNTSVLNTDPMTQVRFLVGDTDTTDQLVQDEEINFILTQEAGTYRSAAQVCIGIAAKFGRQAQRTVGSLSISANQKHEQYKALAQDLRRRANLSTTFYAGGLTQSGKDSVNSDDDRVVPFATKDMHTPPGNTPNEPTQDIATQ